MTPQLFKYPFDKTGKAINNRVSRPVDLSGLVNKPNRCFTVNEGYFFKEELEIVEESGNPLVEHFDYKCTGADRDLMKSTGLEVVCVIVIINPKVSNHLRISCQLVGGPQGHPANEIAKLANEVLNTKREILWNNTDGRPDAFRPSGHFHAMWELFKFEEFNEQLAKIQATIKRKSQARYKIIRDDYNDKITALQARLAEENRKLEAHIANQDDPHRLTALQVLLNKVGNYGLATEQEASQPGTSIQNRYMTPLLGSHSIRVNYLDRLDLHVKNTNNPHGDTAAKAGTLSYEQSDAAFNLKYLKNETVADSQKLESRSYDDVYINVRRNLSIAMLSDVGRMNAARLGVSTAGYAGRQVLTGNKTFRDIESMFTQYMPPGSKAVYLAGQFTDFGTAVNNLSAVFGNMTAYPPGTLGFFMIYSRHDGYNGNGGTLTKTYAVNVAVKLSNGSWSY